MLIEDHQHVKAMTMRMMTMANFIIPSGRLSSGSVLTYKNKQDKNKDKSSNSQVDTKTWKVKVVA